MDFVDNHIWLVGAAILSLIIHTFGRTIEGIAKTTAMSLIMFKEYQERVATHEGRVNDIHRLEFMDRWEHIIGSDIATEVFDRIEKDWMYILQLDYRSEDIAMDLIIILHAKIFASLHLTTYLLGISYYRSIPTGTRLKDCQYVATNLLIFTDVGSHHLLQSFVQLFNSMLSADDVNTIMEFGERLERSNRVNIVQIHDQLLSPSPIDIQSYEVGFKEMLNAMLMYPDLEKYQQEYLLLKFMFGTLDESLLVPGVLGSILNLNYLKLMWIKAEVIYKYLIKQAFKSLNEDEYTMADVLRTILINKAKINYVNRKHVVEKFEKMMPNGFQIFISDNLIKNNANLKDEYF